MQWLVPSAPSRAGFRKTVRGLLPGAFAALSLAVANAEQAPLYYGRVTDSGGHGIAGAVVEAYQFTEQRRFPKPVLLTNLIAGADGRFEVRVPAYSEFVARQPGLAPGWREARSFKTNDAPIVLSAPTTLAGIVEDKAGNPMGGVEVFACSAHSGERADWAGFLWGELARQLFSSRTDAKGRFRIENLPADVRVELDAAAPGQVLPPRRVEHSPENLLWRSGQQDIRLVVEPAVTVEGVIERESGEPLTNTWVELETVGSTFAVPWERVADVTNGGFRFGGLASGTYQVYARFGTNQPPDWVAEAAAVTVQPGQNVKGVELRATKGGVLRVSTIDEHTGKPMAEVYLTVRVGSEYLHATSDTNGLGWFRLSPGRYDLHGTGPGLHQYAEVKVEGGQTNEARLGFSPPPVVSGIVRDPGGHPAPGLPVWLHPGWPRQELHTDTNGRYELVHNENPQVVIVVDPVRDLAVSREIEPGVTNLDLRLAPALTVTGRIQDPQAKPIASTNSLLYLKSGTWGFPVYWQPVTADAQGGFKLVHLPADRAYYVQVNAKGYGSVQQPVPAEDDRQVELPPIVLKPATLKLAGRVVDASDTPLAGASIQVSGTGQPDISARSGSDGRFEVGVCEGAVSLWVRFQELQTSVQARAGDTEVAVVLKPSTGGPERETPKRPSMVGKALPELAGTRLPGNALAPGKPALICLFDCEQRPSRQTLRQLSEQVEWLRQKDFTVLGIQAAIVADKTFDQWKVASPLPFKLGRVTEKKPGVTWATDTDALPWLMLINSQRRVTAEGFSIGALSAKVGEMNK